MVGAVGGNVGGAVPGPPAPAFVVFSRFCVRYGLRRCCYALLLLLLLLLLWLDAAAFAQVAITHDHNFHFLDANTARLRQLRQVG